MNTAVAGRPLTSPKLIRGNGANPLEDLLRTLFTSPAALSLYVTLREASEYSGLTVPLLRRLVKANYLPSIQDRCTKVLRADLENLPRILARLNRRAKKEGSDA